MTTEPPIACTLTEAEMPARRAQMEAIARDLVGAETVVGDLVSAMRAP
jgi:hypothetical protein